MEDSYWITLSLMVAVSAIASLSVLLSPSGTRWYPWAGVGFLVLLLTSMVLWTDSLGFAKPYQMAWRLAGQEELRVIGSKIVIDEAIYVLVDLDPPRLVTLPYREGLAMQLQRAGSEQDGNGQVGGIFLTLFHYGEQEAVTLNFEYRFPKPMPPKVDTRGGS